MHNFTVWSFGLNYAQTCILTKFCPFIIIKYNVNRAVSNNKHHCLLHTDNTFWRKWMIYSLRSLMKAFFEQICNLTTFRPMIQSNDIASWGLTNGYLSAIHFYVLLNSFYIYISPNDCKIWSWENLRSPILYKKSFSLVCLSLSVWTI